ncbi:zinc finger protein 37-like [Littorina saxatilis]|uniref:C2H2-type domain-containing protein n=1 Tax=Littorina saxatilis TaxID=31220 RepID=A0AAN9B091_9CAEN
MAYYVQGPLNDSASIIKAEAVDVDNGESGVPGGVPVGILNNSEPCEMDREDVIVKEETFVAVDNVEFSLSQRSSFMKTEPLRVETCATSLIRRVLVNSEPFQTNRGGLTDPRLDTLDAGCHFVVHQNVDEVIGAVAASSTDAAKNETLNQPMDADTAVKTERPDSGYEEHNSNNVQDGSLSVDNLPVFFGGLCQQQHQPISDPHRPARETATYSYKGEKQKQAPSAKRGRTGLRKRRETERGGRTANRRTGLKRKYAAGQSGRTTQIAEEGEELQGRLVRERKHSDAESRRDRRQSQTPKHEQIWRTVEAAAKGVRRQKLKEKQRQTQADTARRCQNPKQSGNKERQRKKKGETPEQEQVRKAAEAAAKREKRKYLTEEKRKTEAERARIRRQNQTADQKKAQAERARIRRQLHTPEQKVAIATASKVRRQKQTAEQKLAKAEAARKRRRNQTPEKKKALAAAKKRQRQRQALEESGTDKPKRKRKPRPTSGERSKKFVCDLCDAVFLNSKSLTTHNYIHTGVHVPARTFECHFCGAGFSDPVSCNEHLQVSHRENCPYLCQVCGQVFYLSESFKIHMRRHSGERPYTCHVCGASFTIASSLKNHGRIHTGEKPYKCSVCDKSFRFSSALTTHMRSHTNEAPYSCQICRVRYKYASELNKHNKRGHLKGDEDSPNNTKIQKSRKESSKRAHSDKAVYVKNSSKEICNEQPYSDRAESGQISPEERLESAHRVTVPQDKKSPKDSSELAYSVKTETDHKLLDKRSESAYSNKEEYANKSLDERSESAYSNKDEHDNKSFDERSESASNRDNDQNSTGEISLSSFCGKGEDSQKSGQESSEPYSNEEEDCQKSPEDYLESAHSDKEDKGLTPSERTSESEYSDQGEDSQKSTEESSELEYSDNKEYEI